MRVEPGGAEQIGGPFPWFPTRHWSPAVLNMGRVSDGADEVEHEPVEMEPDESVLSRAAT